MPASDEGTSPLAERLASSTFRSDLKRVVDAAAQILDCPLAVLSVRRGNYFVSLATTGLPRLSMAASASFDASTLRARTTTVLCDLDCDPRFAENPYLVPHAVGLAGPVRFYAGAPIPSSNAPSSNAPSSNADATVEGVLSVMDLHGRPFDEAARSSLESLSSVAASLLHRHAAPPAELLDFVTDGFYTVDAEWHFTYANQRAAHILGRPIDTLLGRSMWNVYPELLGTLAEHELRRARRDGQSTHFDFYFRPLQLWIEVRVYPTDDGLAVYFQDISDRKQRTERLRLLKKVVDNAFESVIVTDGDLDAPGPRIVYVNPAFTEMTGYSPDEAVGASPRILQGPETDRRVLDRVRLQLEAGEPVIDETVNYRKDGTPFLNQWSIVPMTDADGTVEYWVSVQRDVTTQRATEEALRTERDLMRGIMETSVAAITVVDAPSGRIIFANEQAESVLGLSRDHITGRTYDAPEWRITDLDGGPFPNEDLPFRRILRTGRPVADVCHAIEWPNGQRRLLRVNGAPLHDADDNVSRIVFAISDITEQHLTERALREERNLLRGIADTSVAAIAVVDEEGIITFANPRIESILGRPSSEIVGRRFDDPAWVPPDATESPIEDETRPLQRVQSTQAPVYNVEQVVVRPDGEKRWVTINGAPLRGESSGPYRYVFAIDDITDRKAWEEEQWRTTARVHALHDIGRAILSASSPEDIAQSALLRLARTVPFDRASVVEFVEGDGVILAVTSDRPTELQPGRTLPLDALRRPDALDPKTVHLVDDLTAEGENPVETMLWEEGIRTYSNLPLTADGRVIGILNLGTTKPGALTRDHLDVAQEVADMIAVALRQARYEAELVDAKEKAEEMNRLKTAFLANMSHEIRTPLTSIIGFAEIITNDPTTAAEFGSVIRESGQRLLRTLNAVLDLAQLEADAFEPTPELVDIGAMVRDVTDDFQSQARRIGIRLAFEAPSAPFVAHLDPHLFERITTNLISNALKFTDAGSVTVRVVANGDTFALIVSDTGIGIDPRFRPHLFDEFKQESTGDARTHEGTGLGLTITKRLVDLMGGTITVQSTKGEGSTFTVALPTKRPRDDAPPPQDASPPS